MSNLNVAFKIPINCENKDFVKYPYIPIQGVGKQRGDVDVNPNIMTIGRCFDIKHGTKNCYSPTYPPR